MKSKAKTASSAASAAPASPAARAPRSRAAAAPVAVEGVSITSPTRVVFPDLGVTKLDVARYYADVSRWILPHLARRPLTVIRFPGGLAKKSFFQKHATEEMPASIQRIELDDKSGVGTYMYVDSLAGLLALVQGSAVELHVWGSAAPRVEEPDRLIFDLDPSPELPFASGAVVEAAKEVRSRLLELGLVSFVKTTGGKGLHVVVPVALAASGAAGWGWDLCKEFTKAIAAAMERDSPERYTSAMSKAKRTDKIFIDYLRNSRGATAVAPYSARGKPGAPVATPIAWEELRPELRPSDFTVETVPRRLDGHFTDPWADMASVRQTITPAMRRKLGLRS